MRCSHADHFGLQICFTCFLNDNCQWSEFSFLAWQKPDGINNSVTVQRGKTSVHHWLRARDVKIQLQCTVNEKRFSRSRFFIPNLMKQTLCHNLIEFKSIDVVLCFGFHLVPCSSGSWWRPDFFCFDDSHKTVTSCVSGHLWVPAVNWVYSKGKRSVRYRICGFEDMTLNTEYKHKRLTQENKLCLEKVWISEKAKKIRKRKQLLCYYMDHRRWPWIFIFGPKTGNVTIRGKIYIACCNHLK